MNVSLFKEPAPVFVLTAIVMMIFLFIESRVRSEKKPYRDYLVYGAFVGVLSIVMLSMYQYNSSPKSVSNSNAGSFLLDRFPN